MSASFPPSEANRHRPGLFRRPRRVRESSGVKVDPAALPQNNIRKKQEIEQAMKPDPPPIDADRFDEMIIGRKLWGLPAIAQALGVSVDTTRRWVNNPARRLPVTRPGGRYFAVWAELLEWLRRVDSSCSKASAASALRELLTSLTSVTCVAQSSLPC